MSSTKRRSEIQGSKDGAGFVGQGQGEMDDIPKKATAAQLANRKIKTLKGGRRTGGATSGFSSGLSQGAGSGQSGGSTFSFSQPQTGNTDSSLFGTQSSGGSLSATNSFPPTQGGNQNPFANSSFPAFGGSNNNSSSGFNFNPNPPSSSFNFATGGSGSNPFNNSTPNTAVNGNAGGGFSGSIFSFGGTGPAAQTNNHPSTTHQKPPPATNFFGATSTTPASQPPGKNLFGSGDDEMQTSPDPSPVKNNQPPAAAPPFNTQPSAGGLFGHLTPQAPKPDTVQTSTPAFNPATTSIFGKPTETPVTNSAADTSRFGASTPANDQTKPSSLFSHLNQTPAGEKKDQAATPAASTPAPQAKGGPFNFLSSTASPAQPTTSLFGQKPSTPSVQQTPAAEGVKTSESTLSTLSKPSIFSNPFGQTSQSVAPETPAATTGTSLFTPGSSAQAQNAPSATPGAPTLTSAFSPFKPASGAVGTQNTAPSFSGFGGSKADATPSATGQQSPFKPTQSQLGAPPPLLHTGSTPAPVFTPPTSSAPAPTPPNNSFQSTPSAVPSLSQEAGDDDWEKKLFDAEAELASLNTALKNMLENADVTKGWSRLLQFHLKKSAEFEKNIIRIKKAKARSHGVVPGSTTLSQKRKASAEDAVDERNGDTLSKKPKPAESSTGSPSKARSATSSLFSNALNDKPTVSNLGPRSTEASNPNNATSGFVPSFGLGNSNAATTGGSSSANGAPSFQPPKFAAPDTGTFLSQFGKRAKTQEEIAREVMEKVKEDEWDSGDEEDGGPSEAEWEAEYWKKLAEKREKERAEAAKAPTFNFSAPASNASSDSGTGTKSLFPVSKPTSNAFSQSKGGFASGASSNGLFGSRLGSPAPSTTAGASVFDGPHDRSISNNNIFGHLSGTESNGKDDEQEDGSEDEAQTTEEPQDQAATESTEFSSKRKSDSSTSEDETLEQSMRKKQQQQTGLFGAKPATTLEDATPKRSLFDRITRDPHSEKPSETTATDETNGATATPAKSTNFGASFNPSTSFGGDQTFKAGTPIKFGSGTPSFNFTPSSPSASGDKAASVGFSFGLPSSATPSTSLLSASVPTSGLPSGYNTPIGSSRATTPFSADEASGKESASEKPKKSDDEGGPNDAQNDAQLRLTDLSAQEKEEYDVLLEVDMSKCQDYVKEGEAAKSTWQEHAKGPLWVLKNKETGTGNVRMRVAPSGTVKVNFNLASFKAEQQNKRTRLGYIRSDGSLGTYLFSFRSAELAKEFADIVNANKPS